MLNTGLMWFAWSMAWLSANVIALLARGLIRVGYSLVRAGKWLEFGLVPHCFDLVKISKPGYIPTPLTDEQKERLDSLHDQMKSYVQQTEETWAALDATQNEIDYYLREFGIRRN